MYENITHLINTLCGVDENANPLPTPDGVGDWSHVAHSLRSITEHGRPFKSDEPAAIARAIGEWMREQLTPLTPEGVVNVLTTFPILFAMVLRAVQKLHPGTCPDEVMMVACDQTNIEAIARDLQATPYRLTEDGRVIPDVTSHPVVSAPFVIDERVKHEFVRRHITPAHYAAHEQEWPESPELEVVDEAELVNGPPADAPPSGKVRKSDLGRLTACPLEGFDEFFEYFYENDHKHWEAGLDIEDLPPYIDPNDRDV